MTRGIHTTPNKGRTVDWLTPPDLFDGRLGDFDLDPCAHPVQTTADWQSTHGVHANRLIVPPEDGLSAIWGGRVWLNPPYGTTSSERWLRRMAAYGHGTALVASRTEVERWWVPYVWQAATAVLFLSGRLHYWTPEGERASGNAGHGSALIAYGRHDAGLLLLSDIKGQFVWLGHERTQAVPA